MADPSPPAELETSGIDCDSDCPLLAGPLVDWGPIRAQFVERGDDDGLRKLKVLIASSKPQWLHATSSARRLCEADVLDWARERDAAWAAAAELQVGDFGAEASAGLLKAGVFVFEVLDPIRLVQGTLVRMLNGADHWDCPDREGRESEDPSRDSTSERGGSLQMRDPAFNEALRQPERMGQGVCSALGAGPVEPDGALKQDHSLAT